MRRSGPGTRTFLLDNNVFIAAIKNPTRETATLRLILKIIQDGDIRLVGDEFHAEEMARYAEAFESEMTATLLYALISKMELVEPRESLIKACKAYMNTGDAADTIHAATCLQTGSILITNDHHFDRIGEEEIITVWDTTRAIRDLL